MRHHRKVFDTCRVGVQWVLVFDSKMDMRVRHKTLKRCPCFKEFGSLSYIWMSDCQYFHLSEFVFVWETKVSFCLIGEIVSVPLARTITSIWPLPFGLLLQQEVEANTPSRVSFSCTSPLLSARDMLLSASNHIQKGEGSLVSSHLILMDPLDEQQVCTTL